MREGRRTVCAEERQSTRAKQGKWMKLVACSQGVRKEHSAERKESLMDEEMTALPYICSNPKKTCLGSTYRIKIHSLMEEPLTAEMVP